MLRNKKVWILVWAAVTGSTPYQASYAMFQGESFSSATVLPSLLPSSPVSSMATYVFGSAVPSPCEEAPSAIPRPGRPMPPSLEPPQRHSLPSSQARLDLVEREVLEVAAGSQQTTEKKEEPDEKQEKDQALLTLWQPLIEVAGKIDCYDWQHIDVSKEIPIDADRSKLSDERQQLSERYKEQLAHFSALLKKAQKNEEASCIESGKLAEEFVPDIDEWQKADFKKEKRQRKVIRYKLVLALLECEWREKIASLEKDKEVCDGIQAALQKHRVHLKMLLDQIEPEDVRHDLSQIARTQIQLHQAEIKLREENRNALIRLKKSMKWAHQIEFERRITELETKRRSQLYIQFYAIGKQALQQAEKMRKIRDAIEQAEAAERQKINTVLIVEQKELALYQAEKITKAWEDLKGQEAAERQKIDDACDKDISAFYLAYQESKTALRRAYAQMQDQIIDAARAKIEHLQESRSSDSHLQDMLDLFNSSRDLS